MAFIVLVGTLIAECLLQLLNQSPIAVPITTCILIILGTGLKKAEGSIEYPGNEDLFSNNTDNATDIFGMPGLECFSEDYSFLLTSLTMVVFFWTAKKTMIPPPANPPNDESNPTMDLMIRLTFCQALCATVKWGLVYWDALLDLQSSRAIFTSSLCLMVLLEEMYVYLIFSRGGRTLSIEDEHRYRNSPVTTMFSPLPEPSYSVYRTRYDSSYSIIAHLMAQVSFVWMFSLMGVMYQYILKSGCVWGNLNSILWSTCIYLLIYKGCRELEILPEKQQSFPIPEFGIVLE